MVSWCYPWWHNSAPPLYIYEFSCRVSFSRWSSSLFNLINVFDPLIVSGDGGTSLLLATGVAWLLDDCVPPAGTPDPVNIASGWPPPNGALGVVGVVGWLSARFNKHTFLGFWVSFLGWGWGVRSSLSRRNCSTIGLLSILSMKNLLSDQNRLFNY